MPHEEDEFALSYYNTMTTWIDIDQLLALMKLTRDDLNKPDRVLQAIRNLSHRMPTYITLKDVKKRWGHGQEDLEFRTSVPPGACIAAEDYRCNLRLLHSAGPS